MSLTQLIYASRAKPGFGPHDVEQILTVARHNNAKLGITGLLCFNGESFLQCLEGDRVAVNELYRHIIDDPRHHQVLLLRYGEIVKRDFENWAMGYLGLTSENKEILLRYATQAYFDPFTMSGASAQALLCELRTKVKSSLASHDDHFDHLTINPGQSNSTKITSIDLSMY